jgi:peptidoglycan/LPS O-acetylase OafA/YrhL
MTRRVALIVPAAVAVVVLCAIVTAAASDHSKRKTHASKPAPKPPAAPAIPDRQRPTM